MFPPGRARLAMKPAAIGVANGCHDDGDRLGRLPRGVGGLGSSRQDSGDPALNELGGKRGQASGLPFCVPEFKPDIPPLFPPALLERGREHTNASLRLWGALDVRQEEAQAPHIVRRLRRRDAVPSECGTTQEHEGRASLHKLSSMRCTSITARGPSQSSNAAERATRVRYMTSPIRRLAPQWRLAGRSLTDKGGSQEPAESAMRLRQDDGRTPRASRLSER